MTCEQCGAPMRTDRERGVLVCDYCGGEAVPPILDDGVLLLGQVKEKCPVCRISLSNGSLESYDILYCEPCRGMLVPMDDFQPLIMATRAHEHPLDYLSPRSTADANRRANCPKCGVAMDGHPYGGGGNVNIDTCESCGVIWLDGGELRRIASARDRVAYI